MANQKYCVYARAYQLMSSTIVTQLDAGYSSLRSIGFPDEFFVELPAKKGTWFVESSQRP